MDTQNRLKNRTRIFIFSSLITASCSYSDSSSNNKDNSENKSVSEKNICKGNSYIQCEASKYDGNKWFSLGKFRSLETPSYASGEPMCNAEISVGNVHFSAEGNYDEGLIYFGSIYDGDRRVGSQIQLARRNEISLYLLVDKEQYSLHCKTQPIK